MLYWSAKTAAAMILGIAPQPFVQANALERRNRSGSKSFGDTLRSLCLVDKLGGWVNRNLVKSNRDEVLCPVSGMEQPHVSGQAGDQPH